MGGNLNTCPLNSVNCRISWGFGRFESDKNLLLVSCVTFHCALAVPAYAGLSSLLILFKIGHSVELSYDS